HCIVFDVDADADGANRDAANRNFADVERRAETIQIVRRQDTRRARARAGDGAAGDRGRSSLTCLLAGEEIDAGFRAADIFAVERDAVGLENVLKLNADAA